MKASAGAAKTSAAKFCNCATGIQRRSGNSGNCATRERIWQFRQHPGALEWHRRAPFTTGRCPLVGACLALAKTFANINPPSRKYMKCRSSPQLFYPHLPGPICQKEGRSVYGVHWGSQSAEFTMLFVSLSTQIGFSEKMWIRKTRNKSTDLYPLTCVFNS